jgi:hypothetical protein
MQIQGELVRATVTAKQRFNEAAYFFDGMQANQTNMTVFPYQLSAFLNAFRSITLYLQKQYARESWFSSWYNPKQAEMANDPTLKMLNDKRVESFHHYPVDLFFKQGFRFPERFGGCIMTSHFEVESEERDDGLVVTRIKVGADGIKEEVATEISWYFSEDDADDVVKNCWAGLNKIRAIVSEIDAVRASAGITT